jgi:predicted HTH domain antitoxin
MPLQVDHRKEVKVEVTYRSVEEIQEELAQRGIRLDLLARALYTKPKLLIDNEGKDVNTDRTK